MFGELVEYQEQAYYDVHPYIYIITPTGFLKYQIFSAHTTSVSKEIYRFDFDSDADFDTFLTTLCEKSVIDPLAQPTNQDRVLTLSTCTSTNRKDLRFVVHAMLIEDART